MIRFACPSCKTEYSVPEISIGRKTSCLKCGQKLEIPSPRAKTRLGMLILEDDDTGKSWNNEPPPIRRLDSIDENFEADREYLANGKYCIECGNRIRSKAIVCSKCGCGQPSTDYIQPSNRNGSAKVALLVSFIGNIFVSMLYFLSCIGAPVGAAMVVLAIFEILLWSSADRLPCATFASRAKTIAIFEIIVGLFNLISLVCGIITLVSAKCDSYQSSDYFDGE